MLGSLLVMRGGAMVGPGGFWVPVVLLVVLGIFAYEYLRSPKHGRGMARDRQHSRRGHSTGAPKTDEERIEDLKDRFVAGELSKEEYEKRLEVLYDS
ncbi:MAG: SHOCT domain-containing protein [Halobacteriota archaeon]